MSKHTIRRAAATALAVTAALGTGLAVAPVAFADPAPVSTSIEEAAAIVEPSIVSLKMTWSGYVLDENGQAFNGGAPLQVGYGCTGFAVDTNGHLATAGHCVLYDEDVKADFVKQVVAAMVEQGMYNPGYTVDELVQFEMQNWTVRGQQPNSPPVVEVSVSGITDVTGAKSGGASPARIVSAEPFEAGDVALLEIDRTGLFALPLAEARATDVGAPVVSVGFPGLTQDITTDPTFKDGAVSAKTVRGGRQYMEISAAIASGMSGGPTVEGHGDLGGSTALAPTPPPKPSTTSPPPRTCAGSWTMPGWRTRWGPPRPPTTPG